MKAYKKILLGIIGLVLVFSLVISQQKVVRAGFPTSELASIPTALQMIWEKRGQIFTSIKNRIINDLVVRNLAYYMDNLSYNVATQLATGGPGQTPLFDTKSIGDSIKDANEAAIGNFIGELSEKEFKDLGLNLCDPSLSVKLTLSLSLIDSKAPPAPKCNWDQVQKNWADFNENFKRDILKVSLNPQSGSQNYNDFFDSFSLSQSDFGAFLTINNELAKREKEAEEAKKLQIEQCQGVKPITTPITEEVIANCSKVLKAEGLPFDQAVLADANKQSGNTGTSPTLMDNIGKIMADAGKRFVNTFSAKLMERWLKRGTWSVFGDDDDSSLRDNLIDRLRGGSNIRQPRDKSIFRDTLTVDISQVDNFSLIDNYSLCPPNPEFRHPDNCVISTPFLSAVNSRRTVREAIEDGLISANIPFISPEDQLRNLSDDCYLTALCHSNVVKLRKANIVPIGWELAALRSPITSPVTLQQAMDCFEDFDDNAGTNCEFDVSDDYAVDGEPHNPFYHLVDPNWVLKIPSAYCDAYVYSPVLESDSSSNRQQYCADVKTCLREDDQGNCLDGQYGYCTRSENIWRFDGEICEDGDLYSGCLTFENDQYGEMSYIEGSLDYCTNDQVGCRRYSQEIDDDNNWIFQGITLDDNDLFLNGATASCTSEEAGCSEYIVMAANTNANLIPNGDFEINEDGNLYPDGFTGDAPISDDEGVNQSNAVRAVYRPIGHPQGHDITCYNDLKIVPNTLYTVSVDVKINSSTPGSGDGRIAINTCVDASGNWGDITSPDGSMVLANDAIEADDVNYPDGFDPSIHPADEASVLVPVSQLSASGYTRISGTFYSGNSVSCSSMCVGANYGTDNYPHFFDNMKIEVVSSPKQLTNYSAYGVGATVYMNDDTFMCLAEEVGCMGYNPANGDPMIPAVITQDDICPAECVGYSTFAEQLTIFDQIEGLNSNDIEYHNFIPNTAQDCPIQEVGCEEFTNLDEVAQGGEGLEYYTNLRQCVMSGHAQANTFFTWEGSDVAGYQIQDYRILKSNEDDGPCTNYDADNDRCIDNALPQAVCGPETPGTILDDPEFDPNCRQYFDANGNSYFRYQDRVIYASDDCHEYRRTATGKLYRAIPQLSYSCQAQNNGCREYVGDTENNVRVVFSSNFEGGSYLPWTNSPANTLETSEESLNNNGHSLKVPDIARRSFLEQGFRPDREYQISFWAKNTNALSVLEPKLYFQSGGSAGPSVTLPMINAAADLDFYNIEAGNWHYYTASLYIGSEDLVALSIPNLSSAEVRIEPETPGGLSPEVFLDNITLKEVVDNTTVIRNSWQTPASCDAPYSGYYLGCQAYTDNNGRNYNLRSFDYLCREEAIGCLPAIDTQNSSYPFYQEYHVGDVSQISVPADSLTYLVPDTANYCAANYKGCQALGLQNRLDPDLASTVYMINDPDRYEQILCDGDGLNCSEYTSSKGTYYFKDPMTETCTYKQNVNVFDTVVSGWFSNSSIDEDTGLAYGCSDTDQAWFGVDGFEFSDLEATSTLALTCPSSKNLCTGFRDMNDPLGCDPSIRGDLEGVCTDDTYTTKIDCESAGESWTDACEVYYYYDNNNIDEGSCNGQVDQNGGCILFYNENQWNAEHDEVVTLYDTEQTYERNISLGYPLGPVACDPSFDPNCDLTSNRLIKVTKDRQCSEWLACKSSAAVYDANTKSYRVICDELGSCLEYDKDNNVSSCSRWALSSTLPEPLSTEVYQQRASGDNDHMRWGDDEYIGYSIPFNLPVQTLETYNFTDENDIVVTRLGYPGWDQSNGSYYYHSSCVNPADPNDTGDWDGLGCTMSIANEDFSGQCLDGKCWLAPNSRETSVDVYSSEARGYAIENAPFPREIQAGSQRLSGYSEANICEDTNLDPNSCEEKFYKVTYGDGGKVLYFPNSESILTGVCLSGQVGSNVLNPDTNERGYIECTVETQSLCDTLYTEANVLKSRRDGMCQESTKIETVYNWAGVCLDPDYSNNIISDDGEARNYCNLWFPVNKIQGQTSLYDNYPRAGYYDEDGEDALFCAVAEPYMLFEDRYYCGGVNNGFCNVLVKVPQGARVNLNGIRNDGDSAENIKILSEGYLKQELPSIYEWRDVDYTEAGFTLGMETIAKANHQPGEGSYLTNKFGVGDFVTSQNDGTYIVLNLERLQNLFDAQMELYYYDEDVWQDGTSNGAGRVRLPDYDNYYMSECGDPDVGTKMDWAGMKCTDNQHLIYDRYYYGGSKCKFLGPRHHNGIRECNPLPYNYYVKAETPDPTIECLDANCGGYACSNDRTLLCNPAGDVASQCGDPAALCQLIIDKGLYCMVNASGLAPTSLSMLTNSNYNDAAGNGYCRDSHNRCSSSANCNTAASEPCLTWPWPSNIFAWTEGEILCNGNPNCEFLSCVITSVVQSGEFNVRTDIREDYTDPIDIINLDNVSFCSDYGSFIYGEDSENNDTIITDYAGCYDRLFRRNNSGDALLDNFGTPVPKAGVNGTLLAELFGNAQTGVSGCLTPYAYTRDGQDAFVGAQCSADTSVINPGSCTYDWFTRTRTCDVFDRYLDGVPCDPELQECYLQCTVITQLDAEADLSFIRTDIWWRNETAATSSSRVNDNWGANYFSDVRQEYYYSYDSDYDNISSENQNITFTHFGAAKASPREGLVVTKVPLAGYRSFGHNEAFTYFSATSTTSTEPIDGDIWDSPTPTDLDAARNLVWLFARTYNLQWDGSEYVNPEDLGSAIPNVDNLYAKVSALQFPGDIVNPFVGDDYEPRIFKVCGESYCENREADGTLIEHEQGITINNISRPEESSEYIYIYGRGGTLFTAAKFYFHAHPDHMPVVNVGVDWTGLVDGTDDFNDSPGKYKNNLVSCGSETLLPKALGEPRTVAGFGGLDRSCGEGYKVLYHTYEYDPLYPCEGTQPGMPSIPGASCYQPLVQVQDRWEQGTWEAFDGWIVVYQD